MQILSLKLKNIRSYLDETVLFAPGLTLLSGDIGSGKTTLLLALEFALFGVQRGGLSGTGLLRHGALRGEVSLTLLLGRQKITIARTLKRTGSSVTQSGGTLTIGEMSTEYTAQELKAKMFELLSYPGDLLQRDVLFRYTVYTPQEEMKAILLDRPEARLTMLRTLFSIDRYQRVKENGALLAQHFRESLAVLKGAVEELRHGLEEIPALQRQKTLLEKSITARRATFGRHTTLLNKAETELVALEKARFEREELDKRCAVLSARIQSLKEREREIEEERKRLSTQQEQESLRPEDVAESTLRQEENHLGELQRRIDEKRRSLLTRKGEATVTARRAETLVANIDGLEMCPTCRQRVDADHKAHIRAECASERAQAEETLTKINIATSTLDNRQLSLDRKRQELLQKLRVVETNRIKLSAREEQRKRIEVLNKTISDIGHQLKAKHQELSTLQSRMVALPQITEEHERRQALVKRLQKESGDMRVILAESEKDLQQVEEALQRLERLETERRRKEAEAKSLTAKAEWLTRHLLPVSGMVERSLFLSVHQLFTAYFRDWAAILLEDETLSVRLDPDFSPLIVQDEYETSIEFLSGGERTSVALAYRLALNRVVNDYLTGLQTRDLLILDEPTDGFSTEQLDRVREVLGRLGLAQIIVVSHEAQLEGLMDHVLRVHKRGHESRVEER